MSSILLLLSLDFSLDISAEYGGWSLDWGLELWRRELWEVEGGALGQQPLPDEPALENPSKSPTPTLQLGQISSTILQKSQEYSPSPSLLSRSRTNTFKILCNFFSRRTHGQEKICHMQDRHYVMSFHFFWPQEKKYCSALYYVVLCFVYCVLYYVVLHETAWHCMELDATSLSWVVELCWYYRSDREWLVWRWC